MGILTNPTRIAGINPKKKPTGRIRNFDPHLPLGPYNFPLTKYTTWKICGYKWRDERKVIKNVFWIEKTLPTGHPLVCPEFDGIISADPIFHGVVPPSHETNKEYHDTPYLYNKKIKWKSQDL